MGSAHNDTIFVGERLVAWVVNVEHRVPHSRPEVVGSQSEEELEDCCVELGIVTRSVRRVREFGEDVASEGRCFIVDENTAVFDGGRLLDNGVCLGVDGAVLLWCRVGPEIPRRNSDLLGDGVETVDCASLVGTCEIVSIDAHEDVDVAASSPTHLQ